MLLDFFDEGAILDNFFSSVASREHEIVQWGEGVDGMIRYYLQSISRSDREGSLGEGVHFQELVSRELVGHRKNLKRALQNQEPLRRQK